MLRKHKGPMLFGAELAERIKAHDESPQKDGQAELSWPALVVHHRTG